MTESRGATLAIFLIPVALGVGLLLYATSIHGVGVSRDSVHYLSAATNLVEAGRLETNILPGTPRPLTLWPPLYSAFLSTLYPFDHEIVRMASILNAILLGLYLIGVQLLVLNSTRGAAAYAFPVGLLAASALATHYIFSRAWSETVFLMLFIYGFLLLGRYLERTHLASLVLGAGVFALAWLARYVGVTLLFTGVLAILIWGTRPGWSRVRDAFIFGALVSAPMVALALYHYGLTGGIEGRGIEYQPVPGSWWYQGYAATAAWLIPGDSPEFLRFFAIGLMVMLVVFGVLFVGQESVQYRGGQGISQRSWIYPALLLLFSAVYVGIFYGVTLMYDPTMDFGSRELAPVFAPILVVVAFTIHELVEKVAKRRIVSSGIIFAVLVMISFQFARTVKWAYVAHDTGLHYNTRAYKESAVIGEARGLPDDVQVFSNNPQLVYFLTDRRTGSIGEQACTTSCSPLVSELEDIESSTPAVLWVPAYDDARCGGCLESAASTYGYRRIAEDEHFVLYKLAPD